MSDSRNRIYRHLSVVAWVAAVSLLGNLRFQASESQGRMEAREAAWLPGMDGVPGAYVASRLIGEDAHASTPDGSVVPGASDEGHLVPAIFAWDQDVRFVEPRHVSKWM